MSQVGYRPYCGHETCLPNSWNRWPRTRFDGKQFVCGNCGWRSSYEPEFIAAYKAKWEAA